MSDLSTDKNVVVFPVYTYDTLRLRPSRDGANTQNVGRFLFNQRLHPVPDLAGLPTNFVFLNLQQEHCDGSWNAVDPATDS